MTEIRLERNQICYEMFNQWWLPAWQKIHSFLPIMQTSGWDSVTAHIYRTSVSKLVIVYCVNRLDTEEPRKHFDVSDLWKSGPTPNYTAATCCLCCVPNQKLMCSGSLMWRGSRLVWSISQWFSLMSQTRQLTWQTWLCIFFLYHGPYAQCHHSSDKHCASMQQFFFHLNILTWK